MLVKAVKEKRLKVQCWYFGGLRECFFKIKPVGMTERCDATSDEQTSTDTVWYNLERDSNGSSPNHQPQATSNEPCGKIRSHQIH